MEFTITREKYWLYGIVLAFILLNAVLVYFEFFYLSAIPILVIIFLIAFTRLDAFLLIIVFLSPISLPIREIQRGFSNDLYLPTEPLLIILLFVFVLKLLYEKNFDRKIIYHPVSLAIFASLIWTFITSITSTMPLVSFKFLISRLWFLAGFYFLATQVFRKSKNLYRYIWLFVIPFLFVIVYATVRHMAHGLSDQKAAHIVSNPFFNDHTAYGAQLAMLLPVFIGFTMMKSLKLWIRVVAGFLCMVFIGAIVLSYTRAAWVSLVGALALLIIVLLKIRFRVLLFIGIVTVYVLIASWSEIMLRLEQNETDSSDYLTEHVQSISNVSSDPSNLERINRWSCAIRMFKEKPFLGWGPGTYALQYAPFQLSYQKTIISTNTGRRGNAHSEYIGPLAEMGFPGLLTFLAVLITSLYTGIMLYSNTKNRDLKIFILTIVLGLTTYFIHGLLNNFLDTDKASAIFWGYIAMLVALEVYHPKKRIKERQD